MASEYARSLLGRSTPLIRLALLVAVLTAALGFDASAQLSGTYRIGSGGDYSSIASAVSDLNSNGVSGPVVFEIIGGTYTLSSGIDLYYVSGMSATNTVTFRPEPGADVTITGSLAYDAIIEINGGSYYVIDGNSSTGSTVTRNMTIRNNYSSTYCSTIWLHYASSYNTIQNCNLQANTYYYYDPESGGAIVMLGGYYGYDANCDYNVIQNNVIGDPNGTYRAPCGVAIYASWGDENDYNEIRDNDIVNFGQAPDYYYDGYGIFIETSRYTLIHGNQIHQTTASASGYLYALYIDDYDGYSMGTTAEGNRIYDMKSSASYSYPYFVFYIADYQSSNDVFTFRNNTIAYSETNGYYLYPFYTEMYGGYGTVIDENNSIYIDGSWQGYCYAKSIYYPDGTYSQKNNIVYVDGSGYFYGLYYYSYYGFSTFTSDYNLLNINANSSGGRYFAYYYNGSTSGTVYSLSEWQSATGRDAHSFTGDPGFVDPDNGDLHIDNCAPALVESRGTPSTYVTEDMDGDPRDPAFPDVGADEGNFNGDGIRVLSPNGGELVTNNYQSDIRVSLSRPLPLTVYLSTNNGSSWTVAATISKSQTVAGTNTFAFTTPNVETATALLKVVSGVNTCEMDQSDRVFSLVRPRVYLTMPNGGQRWTASDTNRIQWQTEYLPPVMSITLEYSTDNGQSWLPIAGSLTSPNKPAVNGFDWIVPNTPSTTALVRAVVPGTTIGDTSDAVFTIIAQPSIRVVTPNGGERLVPGQSFTVNVQTVTTDNVKLEYSLDGGATWTDLVRRLPAYVGSYSWTVPNVPTGQGLIRATNAERPRFSDVSDDYFLILSPELTVLSPNGGIYDLDQPVMVNWSGNDLTTLRLEYSSNNGTTWSTVATGLDGNLGTYTFTPPAIPTDAGRVRLTDETVTTNSDVNDIPFKIAQEPSLLLFQPSGGETYVMGGEATISWESYRVDKVNIEYSLDGGSTWTTIGSNVPAVQGSMHWTLPNQTTTKGEVRVTEAGRINPLTATSGWFSIIEPKHPALRVIAPNGGEHFTEGTTASIRWSATDIDGGVELYYSTDGGATWTIIATNVPATDGGTTGSYDWTVPPIPGTNYRVKVQSTPSVSDASDNLFTVDRKLHPSLTMLYPNGGETMTGGTQETVRWSAVDVPGNVLLSLSTDAGSTWSQLQRLPAAAAQFVWQVPTDVEGDQMLMRVETEDGQYSDVSDATFTIAQPIVPQIVVRNPNEGTEVWTYRDTVRVDWTSENVDQVKIELSIDGGKQWRTIADAVSAAAGTFDYVVEDLSLVPLDNTLLVRVSDVSDPTVFDESDAPFSFHTGISAVPAITGVESGLTMQGIWPNPMRDHAQLRWTQSRGGNVSVRLYGSDGRVARELPIGQRGTGRQSVELEGLNLPSGAYIVEVRVGVDRVITQVVITR